MLSSCMAGRAHEMARGSALSKSKNYLSWVIKWVGKKNNLHRVSKWRNRVNYRRRPMTARRLRVRCLAQPKLWMCKICSQYHHPDSLMKINHRWMVRLLFKVVVTRNWILLLWNNNSNNKITHYKNKENIKRNNKRKREEIRISKTKLTPEHNCRFNINLYRSLSPTTWDKCQWVQLKWCLSEPIKWCHKWWRLSKSILLRVCSLQASQQCLRAKTLYKVNNNRQQFQWLVSKCFSKHQCRCLKWFRVGTIQERFHMDNLRRWCQLMEAFRMIKNQRKRNRSLLRKMRRNRRRKSLSLLRKMRRNQRRRSQSQRKMRSPKKKRRLLHPLHHLLHPLHPLHLHHHHLLNFQQNHQPKTKDSCPNKWKMHSINPLADSPVDDTNPALTS